MRWMWSPGLGREGRKPRRGEKERVGIEVEVEKRGRETRCGNGLSSHSLSLSC